MVARLRGRPSPRPPGPTENEEATTTAKASSSQRTLMILTVVSLLAAVGATGTLAYFTLGPGRVTQTSHADLPASKTGPLMDLGPFIVNLGNVNDRRYLRIAVSLDFQTHDPAFTKANQTGRMSWLSHFKSELKDKEAIFKDVIVTTLSDKQPEALGQTSGKDAVKADLISRLNSHMGNDNAVIDVYFTDFVIQ